jgi:hypothetical protein
MASFQESAAPQEYDILSYGQDAANPEPGESSDEYFTDEEEQVPGPAAIRTIAQGKQATVKPVELPPGFLDGPPPNLKKSKVEFKRLIPEYEDKWAMLLDGVLSEDECKQLIAVAEATSSWERAMVNIGGGRQALYEDTRKCGRVIINDRELAAKIWARVKPEVPEIYRLEDWPDVMGNGPTKRNEVWKMTRLNEFLRFLKYTGGEYFKGKNRPNPLQERALRANRFAKLTATAVTRRLTSLNGHISPYTCISTAREQAKTCRVGRPPFMDITFSRP